MADTSSDIVRDLVLAITCTDSDVLSPRQLKEIQQAARKLTDKIEGKYLRKRYGHKTANAVTALRNGDIPKNFTKQQLAAYKAWMTMGLY